MSWVSSNLMVGSEAGNHECEFDEVRIVRSPNDEDGDGVLV